MLDRKYERQMSMKERRKFEAEKMQAMTLKEKIEYLWMYYKVYLLIPVVIVALIVVGMQMYHGMTEKVLLNLAILGGDNIDRSGLDKEITELLGTGDKKETVKINANLSGSSDDYNSNIALSTLVGAEAVDVIICPEEIYESYTKQSGFMNLEKILSEEAIAGGKVQGDAVVLETSSYMTDEIGISYEPVYVCIMSNAQNEKQAVKFIEMLLEKAA